MNFAGHVNAPSETGISRDSQPRLSLRVRNGTAIPEKKTETVVQNGENFPAQIVYSVFFPSKFISLALL